MKEDYSRDETNTAIASVLEVRYSIQRILLYIGTITFRAIFIFIFILFKSADVAFKAFRRNNSP